MSRHPVVTIGNIELRAGAISCMVRNLSAAGAELSLAAATETPKRFTLNTAGSRLPCHVIWRRDRRIGIAFH